GSGVTLAARVSVHTGLVVVGEIGGGTRQERLALGETPNIAARLQAIAKPGAGVISGAKHRLGGGRLSCSELGVQTLRGVSAPVGVYEVMGTCAARSRLEVQRARGLTPLVGREQEVGLLLERWDRVRESLGQLVLLSGEPGIGKSR